MIGNSKFTATFLICCVLCCAFATAIVSTALAGDAASDNNTSNSSVSNSTIENDTVSTIPVVQVDNPSIPGLAPLNPAFIEYQQEQAEKNNMQKSRVISGTSQIEESGLTPSPVDLGYLSRISAADVATLPDSYDLRAQNKVTSPKHQDPAGTCWTFATCWSLESYLMPNESYDFSENNMKNLLSSKYATGFNRDANNGGGNFFESTAYLANWSGPVLESEDHYDPYGWLSPTDLSAKKHVQDVYFIPSRDNSTDNNQIKWAIIHYNTSIATGVSADASYYNAKNLSYYYNGDESNGHAVAIVGWDDNFDRNNFTIIPPGNGAFIIKNSDSLLPDYFYISYYDSNIASKFLFKEAYRNEKVNNMAFTAENITNYDI